MLQKSTESLLKKWVKHNSTGPSTVQFSNLSAGKWALIIDAKGYTFPSSTTINIPDQSVASITLTPLLDGGYSYKWSDD